MIAYLSVIVAILGLILYLATSKPKPSEIGRILFFTGLLAFLLAVGEATVSLLKG
jgi:hypothetical protein